MVSEENEESLIVHIGIKRRSGRYPWGSGDNPHQRAREFKDFVADMLKSMTPSILAKWIADYSGEHFTTDDLRAGIAISTTMIREENTATAERLRGVGTGETRMSVNAIATHMGVNESTVRGWLNRSEEAKANGLTATADVIRKEVDAKEWLDVGASNHLYLGVSSTRFNTAVAMLRDEGYELHTGIKTPQLGNDKLTTLAVLGHEGTTWNDARQAVVDGKLRIIASQSDDGGETFRTPKPEPTSVPLKKVEVRYGDEGGTQMDGVIELRRDVDSISLGGKRYGQVRIAVDGTHYLKGMAMYADDLPPGVDMRFNTNKSRASADGDPKAVMKPMKFNEDGTLNQDNPFGATVRPRMYTDSKGKEQQSPLNMVNEEGSWDQWSKNLSSQMLSKQPVTLAATQLGKARQAQEKELDTILALTNPIVKEKLLREFADNADAAAVHLKAGALDRQSTHVILPINAMRPHEIYAPNFQNGEKVVLIRHPHGGPFEIPELTVNNLNRTAKRVMGGATDAVGIHHSVAEQLSGADFDGDTVIVIPNDSGKVKTKSPLSGLQNFEPKTKYPKVEGMQVMTKDGTQREMGAISNLITDMTIHKANDAEIARAVRHSMVVIDAEKHGLNYKQSEIDNNIIALKRDYQGGGNKGASTIISRASSVAFVPQRKLRRAGVGDGPIDPKTGELVYDPTGAMKPDRTVTNPKTGEVTIVPGGPKMTKGSKMEFTKDANLLTSDSPQPIESVYAAHANSMKALANRARLEGLNVGTIRQSSTAKALYANEVETLTAKLRVAQRNAPRERRAQTLARAMAKQITDADPSYDKDAIKKIQYSELERAREITGASKTRIGTPTSPLLDREWAAIQAGAVSTTTLREILANADMKRVRELATPRYRGSLTPGQLARAKAMAASNRSPTEIAEALGLPRSTVVDNLANG